MRFVTGIERSNINFWAIFLLTVILAYISIGVFPFALYETDALGVINGCKRIIETGKFDENYYTYNFSTQPGIFFWVVTISKVLAVNLIKSYSIVSAFFGFAFFVLSGYLLTRLLKVPIFWCLLALLSFQEIYTACFYMNSATAAATFMMAGFVVVLNQSSFIRLALGGILLSLSAWSRFDVLIAFPVVIALIQGNTFGMRLIGSAWIFFAFILSITLLCFLSNDKDFFEGIIGGGGSLSFWENLKSANSFYVSQFVRSFLGFFSIFSLILIIYGTYLLYRNKCWNLLLICLFPVLLFLSILGGRVVAGKHLLYYTPFFAIPVIYVFRHISERGYKQYLLFIVFLSTSFVLQYMIGVQVFLKAYPYVSKEYSSTFPDPTYFSLFSYSPDSLPMDSIRVVIGGGTKLSTSDEMFLSSGILFSPLMWYNLKSNSRTDYEAISDYINSSKEDTIHITTSQGGIYPVKNLLYLNGFNVLNPEGRLYSWGLERRYIWNRDKKYVIVDQGTYSKDNYREYVAKLSSYDYRKYLHIAFWDWERWYLNRDNRFSCKLHNVGYLFIR